jgi:hypothetical protein
MRKKGQAMKKPAKRPVGKKTSINKKKAKPSRGCCTLRGSGPDEQCEGLTREECRRLGIERGKNDSWVPGRCAEP